MASQPLTLRPATVVTLGRLGVDGAEADGGMALLSQPKRLAVLLYVLMSQRGGALSRDQVISVFWPESDSTRARNSLRQTLSYIRTCLGQDAIRSVGAQGLTVAPQLTCDAVQFETLLNTGRREDALQLYGGELLPGFHVIGAGAFEEWLDHRRLHLSQRAVRAAWELSAECEARGDQAGAAFWGKRALALSPFSELEVQRLLRVLLRVGDYAGVLRAFEGLQRALQREYEIGPSEETVQLAATARERLSSAVAAPATPSRVRRSGADRRVAQRRKANGTWKGVERRRKKDRRASQRRSGFDRRASPPP
jgi:DNA-binding SARP family transcriptional activator